MKRFCVCFAFVLLSLGLAGRLEAGSCSAVPPLTLSPAIAPQSTAPQIAVPTAAQPADPAKSILQLDPLSSAKPAAPPPPDCGYTACWQTPEGCGCEGFYCGQIFICGYPWV
jgi:hypothetical protein